MIPNATSSNLYLPLFGGGGTAAPPKNGLTWGLETLDVFQRPISSANPVLAASETLDSGKPIDPVTGLALGSYGFEGDGYFDWVNEMIAFREAARLSGENASNGTPPDQSGQSAGSQGTDPAGSSETGGSSASTGSSGQSETGTDTASGSGSGTGSGSEPDTTTGSGTGTSSGGTSGGNGGLLGFLVG